MPDILENLTQLGPALNATSDMPEIAPEAVPPTSEPAPEPAPQPEPTPQPDARERREQRFSELTRQRDEERQRATRAIDAVATLTEQNKALLERMEQILAPKQAAPAEEPRPSREAFDTPDTYEDALISWSSRRAAREAARVAQSEWESRRETERQAEAERQANEAQQRTQDEVVQAWNQRRTEAIKKYPDFADVAEGDVRITLPMRDAILTLDDGAEVAYHLGKNPDEAARIANLSPVRQVAEIGRIAARLAQPAPQPPPPPPPINPLRGGTSSGSANPEDDPGYMDRRLAEMRAQRTPGNIGMIKQ